jgi:hypothetical protein
MLVRRRRALLPRLTEHETDDEHRRKIKVRTSNRMNVALHAGGWHDIFSGGSIRNSCGSRKRLTRRRVKGNVCSWGPGRTRDVAGRQDW